MGQNIVKPEQRGLSPLAVSELAKEFRRLAAEAYERRYTNPAQRELFIGHSEAFDTAAQMLEEKLNADLG